MKLFEVIPKLRILKIKDFVKIERQIKIKDGIIKGVKIIGLVALYAIPFIVSRGKIKPKI